MNQKIKKYNYIVITLIMVAIFLFQQMASKTGTVISNIFDYSMIDENNTYMYISVHHIVQMVFALVVVVACTNIWNMDFGITLGTKAKGFKYTCIFTLVMLIYVIVSYAIGYLSGSLLAYNFPLNLRNVLGTIMFQLFLSGPSEELLFRALPITILAYLMKKEKRRDLAIIIISSAFLFSIAHIKWSINPFTVSFDVYQLVYAFALGIVYGVTYLKTKSIIYPILMHSLSNVLMVSIGYFVQYVL